MRQLIEKNASLEVEDDCGNTPLILAILRGHLHVVELLLNEHANKVNIEACNQGGFTALACALFKRNQAVVDLLIEHHANQDFAQTVLTEKSLAHVWGLKGHSTVLNETLGFPIEIPLEGLDAGIALDILFRYAEEFFSSSPAAVENAPPGFAEKMLETIALAAILPSSLATQQITNEELFARLQEGEPIFISSGYAGHAASILVVKKNEEYQFMVCNRGAGMMENAIEFYSMQPQNFDVKILATLRQQHANLQSFQKMLQELHLDRDCSLA